MEQNLIKSIAKMRLEENDCLVVETGHLVSLEEIRNIVDYFKEVFPKNKIIVLPKDFNIKIISDNFK